MAENQFFLDEGAMTLQGLGVLGEQVPRLYDGTIFRGCNILGGSGSASNMKAPFLGGLSLHFKPPYRIMHGNFLWAVWDTSHWNFFVKFGLKTA